MPKTNTNCKNCQTSFESDFKFCPNCGMNTKENLTVGVLFYNTISNYLLYDSRFFKSFLPLLFKPGLLAEKFIQGKRLSFLHPAQLYLFVSFIFFVLLSFAGKGQIETLNNEFKRGGKISIGIDSIQQAVNDSIELTKLRKSLEDNKFLTRMNDKQIDSIVTEAKGKPKNQIDLGLNEKRMDSLLDIGAPKEVVFKEMGMTDTAKWYKKIFYEQWLKFYKGRKAGDILKSFYDTIPIALFVLLPIFALILKLLFFRRGRYAHHLVFSFYLFSYLFIVFTLIMLANLIIDIPGWISFLVTLSTFVYFMVAVRRFYGQGWFLSWLKSGVATTLFLFFVVPVAIGITGLISFFLY